MAKPETNEVPELKAERSQTCLYKFVLYLLYEPKLISWPLQRAYEKNI